MDLGSRATLSVDAALFAELSVLSKRKKCPPIMRATDNAIREYIEREKGRTEEQWWDETLSRLEMVNHVKG